MCVRVLIVQPNTLFTDRWCARVRGSLHCLTEDTSQILWPLRCHLLLKAPNPAHFIHKGQIPAEIPDKELCSLTTHARCLFALQKHNDLHDAFGVRNRRISLPPARKF